MKRSGKRRGRYLFFIIILLILAGILIKYNETILKFNYPVKYKEQVIKYSKESGTNDPFLIFAIIKAESNFKEKATSHRNARGLMQLMDATAGEIANRLGIKDFESQNLYIPDINIRIGSWHVSNLIKYFGRDDDFELVIAAYNGGGTNVKKWLNNKKYSKDGIHLDYIPFKETENFLKRVKGYYQVYKRLYENEF